MITMHYNTPVYNGLPLTRDTQLNILNNILTSRQQSLLDKGKSVKLSAKQQVLMSINIYRI